jgi:hypothetical protein
MVEEEPVLDRDLTIMGQLRILNIGKGLTFQPDAPTRAVLDRAAAGAHAWTMEGYATNGDFWWPTRRWRSLAPWRSPRGRS